MAVPMEHVLALPELLEHILFSLDERTLLTSAQRVCTHWRGMIQQSPVLQEKLFFKPGRRTASDAPESTTSDSAPAQQPTLNPLLIAAFPAIFRTNYLLPCQRPFRFSLRGIELITNPAKRTAYLRPNASWRSMFLQQPPAYSFGVFQECSENPVTCEIMKSEGGLRMETLFELLFFHEDLTLCNYPNWIVWWGQSASVAFEKVLESSSAESVDEPDLLVCAIVNSVGPGDPIEENEDQDVVNAVQDKYRELGLEPKALEPEWVVEKTVFKEIWGP
ncbi:F-box protein [Aspergillus aculeatinus CBS 121060]|uniref:Uncharacterized protein n=1 Tax=Aspergillus aculeatinus CBS 121060 TaxID=1448322 RepID=A0ACD1GTP0_9EURO|nr:hypothetical protein BO66DRAFT_475606 [Aspergillus aculeatinus CBS 121060]RAH64688.1 hypothetical protein BO66DRAFT_475606 [Aspergillus aculeatinus CBS 121060]